MFVVYAENIFEEMFSVHSTGGHWGILRTYSKHFKIFRNIFRRFVHPRRDILSTFSEYFVLLGFI